MKTYDLEVLNGKKIVRIEPIYYGHSQYPDVIQVIFEDATVWNIRIKLGVDPLLQWEIET